MNIPAKGLRHAAKGYDSETGRLRKVVMCPPTFFTIVEPINAVQWFYHSDGLPRPDPRVMVQQHRRLIEILQEEGVEVELLPPVSGLPYQHATRDIGAVIGDTMVVSCLKERTRRLETQVAEPVLRKYGLRMVTPERGFVEGGDVIVDNGRLWVGLGARTDQWGVEFLDRTFGRDFDVIPLFFAPEYTHLDTVFGILGRGHALVYEPAFELASLHRIKQAYASIVSLTATEQKCAGANVLPLDSDKVISIAESCTVSERLVELGYKVLTIPFSEVIKSGGSVRCDTLPIDRDPTSSEQVLTV